ncbi:hypothetical protein J2X11_000102 [Aeromicrobium panaciterrae]|uniref:TIGR04086 family membrane protein n=1 Tax=Aeromicrobium panaciterrae TaxID=363861 RepID=A0ABU1UJA0_9ACTN|nr:hypothetical protein [Aeromicrobium panaciterrae]MDR7085263.1 hypothetical protein [Aeromicrobium panaciterrae]
MTSAKRQIIRPFSEQPVFSKVFAAVFAPVLFGSLAGWLLGVSAVGYLIAQVVATIGGVLAGMEHVGPRTGAIRGVIGGTLFGSSILFIRSLTDRADEVSLGSAPWTLVIITAVVGTILGALGGRLSRIG